MSTGALDAALSRTSIPGGSIRTRLEGLLGFAGDILTVLFVVLACMVLVAAIGTRFSKNNQYTLFGHPALIVLSGSMTPAIDTGDFVVDRPARDDTHLHSGQIITFYDAPGSHVVLTHRIIQVVRDRNGVSYRTKGDANAAPDPILRPAGDVIGVYEFRIPRGGYLLTNIHRPIVLGFLLAAPILWLAGALLRGAASKNERVSPPIPEQPITGRPHDM